MKAKSWFLTILLSLAMGPFCFAVDDLDEFIPSDMDGDLTLTDGDYKTFTGSDVIDGDSYTGIGSRAQYVGKIGYDATNDFIYLDNKNILATKTSGGRLKNISITWSAYEDANTNTSKTFIYLYAGTTEFTGTEIETGVKGKATKIGSFKYSEGNVDFDIDPADGYTHFALVGTGNTKKPAIAEVDVIWERIIKYTVSVGAISNGSISLGKTKAEKGETVTMTITPDDGYECTGYQYGATVVNLSETKYFTEPQTVSFTMPEGNTVVTATFRAVPDRELVDFYFYATAADVAIDEMMDEAELISGRTKTVYFATDPIYVSDLLTFDVDASSVVEIVSHTYNKATGVGTVTLRGLDVGDATLSITTTLSDDYDIAIGELPISVVMRQVVLVTEYEGKYYAVVNVASGNYLCSQEVVVAGGTMYYDPAGTYNLAQMTWYMKTMSDLEGDYYAISDGSQYLATNSRNDYIKKQATKLEWTVEAGVLQNTYDRCLCYVESDGLFKGSASGVSGTDGISVSVHEIAIENVSTMTTYSRSQKADKYATICFPFAVSTSLLSGVEEIYNITGKVMSGVDLLGIEMEVVEDEVLEEGKPYVIMANSTTLSVKYGAKTTMATTGNATGLVGNMSASPINVPVGCYGFSNNLLRKVAYAGTATTGQYKAYIDISTVPTIGAPAPGRRVLYAENVGTSVEDILNGTESINWSEPVYNIMGQQVGKGTTGVLIQNGQKFLVQ